MPAQQIHALAYAQQAQAAPGPAVFQDRLHVKAPAPVADHHMQQLTLQGQLHPGPARARVAHHVVERLLQAAVDGQAHLGGQVQGQLLNLGLHLEQAGLAEGLAEVAGRRGQAEAVQDGRTKIVGQGAHPVHNLLGQADEPFHLRAASPAGGLALQADLQGREQLAHLVVQVLGQAFALVLLGSDEPPGQLAHLALGQHLLGHVAGHPPTPHQMAPGDRRPPASAPRANGSGRPWSRA